MAVVEYESPVEVLTETEKRARTLEAAALEIEVRGHCRYQFQSEKGEVCMAGAINFALGLNPLEPNAWTPAWHTFHGVRSPLDSETQDAIWSFNDAQDRKPEEVTFLLRWRAEEIRDGWDA